MADFPALAPSARPLTPGQWGGATLPAMSGQTSTVRRSSAEIGRRLSLRFEAITEAQFLQIVTHYQGQRSGLDGFSFTTTTLPSAYTPTGHSWVYASPPQVTDQHADVFDVEIECRSEPRAIFRARGVAFVQQPALSAGTITTPISGATLAPALGLAAGSITGITSGAAFWVSDSAGGAADSGVQLLLRGNGDNNSTTFADSSFAPRSITANGNVKISTDQSKFGGSSIYCDGTGDFLSFTAISIGTSDDCTLEAWIYPTSTADRGIFGHSNASVNMQPLTLLSGSLQAYWDGTTLAGTTITANTWTHVAITRSAGTLRLFQGGTLTATAGASNTKAVALDRIGRTQYRGDFIGWIDEVRVTVGLARYTATFTAPTAAFPAPRPGAGLTFAAGAPV